MKSTCFEHGRSARPCDPTESTRTSGGGGCPRNSQPDGSEPAQRPKPYWTIYQLSSAPVLTALALFLVIGTVAVGTGCGSAPTPSPKLNVDPEAILEQAIGQLNQLSYASFLLDQPLGTTELLPGLEMSRVYGVVANPDRFRFTVEAQVGGAYAEIDMVVIADQAYMTNFFTGKWEEVGLDLLPVNFANLGESLSAILGSIQSPSLAGTESLGKRPVYLVQGRVDSGDLSRLVPNAAPGFNVMLELWLEQSSSLLLRVVITGQVISTDIADAVRVLTLDDIDLPVEIAPPL